MKKLTIITDTWRIIEAETFFSFQLIEDEEDEQPVYHLIGVLDPEDGSVMTLSTRSTQEEIVECFENLHSAIEAGRKIVDFRNAREGRIDIIRNSRQRPDSQWN